MFTNINKIFCINLVGSENRKQEFLKRFPELTENSIFEWYMTERDSENPERGCYNSHKNILELAKKKNYSQIIIFEDDAKLLESWKDFIEIVNGIKYPEDWKSIQLGYFPHTLSRVKDNETVVQVNCSITSHCYIANVSKLVIPEYNDKGIDIVLFCPGYKNYILNEKVEGMYGIYPRMLVMQSSKESTIDSSRNSHGDLHFDRNYLIKIAVAVNYVELIIILGLIMIITIVVVIIFKYV